MSNFNPPPIDNPVVDQGGIATIPWTLYFNSTFTGDAGTTWIPQFTNLTVVGASPTITGRIYRLSRYISYFSVNIVPGTNTSATAGSTYINNFPLTMRADGICFAVSGLLGSNSGSCDRTSNRVYVPTWTTVTVPLTVIGIVEAS